MSRYRSGSVAKEDLKRRFKKMYAKHADSDWLNGLSGRVIGCVFTVLNTLGAGVPLALELRASGIAVVSATQRKSVSANILQTYWSRMCCTECFDKPRLEIKRA